jgi:hypothetical protein
MHYNITQSVLVNEQVFISLFFYIKKVDEQELEEEECHEKPD